MSIKWIVNISSVSLAEKVRDRVTGFRFQNYEEKIADSRLPNLDLIGDYKGKAYRLCRTDWKDDVCTSHLWHRQDQLSEAVSQWKKRFRLGVRISEHLIAPIDRFSDG